MQQIKDMNNNIDPDIILINDHSLIDDERLKKKLTTMYTHPIRRTQDAPHSHRGGGSLEGGGSHRGFILVWLHSIGSRINTCKY